MSAKKRGKSGSGGSGSKGLGTKRALSVWLKEEDIEALKEIAHERGIGHTTLVRVWVREKLQKERGGKAKRRGSDGGSTQ